MLFSGPKLKAVSQYVAGQALHCVSLHGSSLVLMLNSLIHFEWRVASAVITHCHIMLLVDEMLTLL